MELPPLSQNYEEEMKIKPCPFCEAIPVNESVCFGANGSWVVCPQCEAAGPIVEGKATQAAIKAWNERKGETQ